MSCLSCLFYYLEYFHQPACRIDGIVIPKIAVGKEQMPAHFPRQCSADLLHPGLDKRMSCLPHDGIAAMGTDVIVHRLGTLDLRHECSSRLVCEDIARKDDHELVSPEDVPLFVYYSDSVGISVKGDACVRFLRRDSIDENMKIFRYRGIRMMIGECAIRF